ncbi:MAG: magnesium chelatase ATPase subunit D [Rhodobacteraceae bacterium PARR1]|nr:MAG: magnesium chelatase ATPase subunit D [Rhodobacteraceae bacterium PARR1]
MEEGFLRSALAVLAVDPVAVGGLWLRARAGPYRQRLLESLTLLPLPLPLQRLSPQIGDEALYGGLDAVGSLQAGRPVLRRGMLDRPSLLVLTMAERCPPALAARLAQTLDQHHHGLLALDEAAEAGEGLPATLSDRLGLFLDLDGERAPDVLPLPDPQTVLAARALLPSVRLPHDGVIEVVRACAELAILSPRAPILTLAVARALAALDGRSAVETADLRQAAALALSHRAAPMAEAAEDPPDAPPPEMPPGDQGSDDRPADPPPETDLPLAADMLVEAARTALPDSLLRDLAEGRASRAAKGSSGSGAERAGNRRGRPLPSRKGRPRDGSRIDLIATLRAAAPWQAMRRRDAPHRAGQVLLVDTGDLHIRRAKVMSDRVLIFAVDASGSAAIARLAEAKGAVELLLARAYSRRDHVALLTFRGRKADLLLPPTRSLVQTKNRLRGVPGGGATPLADGLRLALDTAGLARARGMTPTIALLTDGKGNIALDGTPDRALCEAEANQLAATIRRAGLSALVIDLGLRPQPRLADLAARMGARYVVLPRADAGRLAQVLGASLEA